MTKSKRRGLFFSFLGTLLLLALIVGAGTLAYRAGFGQGLIASDAFSGDAPIMPSPRFAPYGHYGYGYRHFGMGNFFFGILFFFLMLGLVKRLLFFPRWGWYGGPRGYGKMDKHGMRHPRYWAGPWHEDDEEGEDSSDEDDEAQGEEA